MYVVDERQMDGWIGRMTYIHTYIPSRDERRRRQRSVGRGKGGGGGELSKLHIIRR